MSRQRPDLVICGQVVVAAEPDGLQTAEAIGIAGGRVVVVGARRDVRELAAPDARVVDVRDRAVIPGLHDFHIHLVGLARARMGVSLDGARDLGEVAERVRRAAAGTDPDAWLTGRGWSEAQLAGVDLPLLEEATGGRPALFMTTTDTRRGRPRMPAGGRE